MPSAAASTIGVLTIALWANFRIKPIDPLQLRATANLKVGYFSLLSAVRGDTFLIIDITVVEFFVIADCSSTYEGSTEDSRLRKFEKL